MFEDAIAADDTIVVPDGSTKYIVNARLGIFITEVHKAGPLEFGDSGAVQRVRDAAHIVGRHQMTDDEYTRYLSVRKHLGM